jgi:hypothetical protein
MSGPEILIPITFFVTAGALFMSRSEIGKAIAHRIRNGGRADDQVAAELSELRRDLDVVRAELAETQERLDFAERLLAQGRTPDQLPR